MFTVVVDGNVVYDPDLTSLGYVIFQPRLTVGFNKSGEFSFVIPSTNPYYSQIEQISSRVFVLNNGSYEDVLFVGRVLNVSIDFSKNKTVNCEGAMSYLVDSVLRPYYFEGTPNDLFEYYVGKHNATVDPDNTLGKRLVIGRVNVDSGTQIVEGSDSYVSTLEEITNKLIGRYGGYIVTRWDNNNQCIVLDYISDVGRDNSQLIQYSRNLLDLIEEQPAEDIYTVAIPLGAQIYDEETGENYGRVSIANYPQQGNPDYIEASSEFVDRFGRIEKTFIFDDIDNPDDLYTIGEYLVSFSALIPSRISIKAIDLNIVDSSFTQIKVGDLMSVVSQPHGVDRQMLCTGIDYDLFEPGNTVYDFEIEETYSSGNSLSSRQNTAEHEIRLLHNQNTNVVKNAIDVATQHINDAMAEASSEIANALGGYVYKTYDELFIMNTDDISTATSVWRWNVGGLGYWTGQAGHALDPDAIYTIAITASGTINAEVLRGELMETIRFNAVLGKIGDWDLSPEGIYKVVADSEDASKYYRVRLYPPSQINAGTSKVLSFEISTDYGATYEPSFIIRGDGSFTIASRHTGGPYTNGPEQIKIYQASSPENYTVVNSTGFHVYHPFGGISDQAHLWTSGLTLKDGNDVNRAWFTGSGAYFYDSNGNRTASYPAAGWQTVTFNDPEVVGGQTTWRYLQNGKFIMMICRREFSSVVVDHQWGNIFCGPNDSTYGTGVNFPSVAYPFEFDTDPMVVAQIDVPNSQNDGWLVTNAQWTQSNRKQFLPAYDLARGTSITAPSVAVNYVVFGYWTPKYDVINHLTNVTNSNASTTATMDGTYSATLTATTGKIMSVTVTMNGEDITDQVWTPNT